MDGSHHIGSDGVAGGRLGNAEVGDFHLSVLGDHNILGLDIPVDDMIVVGCLDPHAHLDGLRKPTRKAATLRTAIRRNPMPRQAMGRRFRRSPTLRRVIRKKPTYSSPSSSPPSFSSKGSRGRYPCSCCG